MGEEVAQVLWSTAEDQLGATSVEFDPGARSELDRIIETGVVTLDSEGVAADSESVRLAEQRLRLVIDAAVNEARHEGLTSVTSQALDYGLQVVIPLGFWPFTVSR